MPNCDVRSLKLVVLPRASRPSLGGLTMVLPLRVFMVKKSEGSFFFLPFDSLTSGQVYLPCFFISRLLSRASSRPCLSIRSSPLSQSGTMPPMQMNQP